jgi:hypothetical protein
LAKEAENFQLKEARGYDEALFTLQRHVSLILESLVTRRVVLEVWGNPPDPSFLRGD